MCAHPGVTGGGAKALEESERPIRPKRCPVCCLRDEQAIQLAQQGGVDQGGERNCTGSRYNSVGDQLLQFCMCISSM